MTSQCVTYDITVIPQLCFRESSQCVVSTSFPPSAFHVLHHGSALDLLLPLLPHGAPVAPPGRARSDGDSAAGPRGASSQAEAGGERSEYSHSSASSPEEGDDAFKAC